jgi:ribosomal protein L11 methyltransferase
LNWLEVSVHTSREAVEAVIHQLQELGADGVSIEDSEVLNRVWEDRYGEIVELKAEDYPAEGVIVKAYWSEQEQKNVNELAVEVRARVKKLREFGLNPAPATVETRLVSEESWANEWKRYYKTVHATDRITVKPLWEEYEPRSEDERVIELDPGMAFGTGTHPSTLLSIRLLEKYLHPGARVIDVGCGSGILSIVAAKLEAGSVLALDLDPLAVEKARENVALNGEETRIRVEGGDLLKGVSETADLVVANILAEIILRFIHDLPRVLVPGGIFIASGIIEEKAEQVKESLRRFGLEVLETIHLDGWVAIAVKKW